MSGLLSVEKPDIASTWHPTLNGSLTPSDVTLGSTKTVYWICGKGHEWEAMIDRRVKSSSSGCPYCAGKKVCPENCLANINPQVATTWHPTRNGDLTAQDVVPKSDKRRWWICSEGHEWQATISSRTRRKSSSSGCPWCAGKKVCPENCLANINPQVATTWHPTLNGDLTAQDVVPWSRKNVWWRCSEDQSHEWFASINNRSKGSRCPHCHTSKGEESVKRLLGSIDVRYKQQFRLRCQRRGKKCTLRFDFAVAKGDGRGLIEYHGIQHYEPVPLFGGTKQFEETQKRDHLKRETCRRNGVPLLEIPHWDFDNIDALVTEFVSSL